ncbi:MAG TPA: homoserine dehydrogenase [Acidimicrobiales bacterium]|nr:homoserine dehydrogenase [Acidimicrobiales bacterium]
MAVSPPAPTSARPGAPPPSSAPEDGGAARSPKPVRLGLLGCGNVGAAFVSLVDTDAEAIAGRTGIRLDIVKVAVRDPGRARAEGISAEQLAGRLTTDGAAVVDDPEVGVVVELIGGIEPARSLVRAALSAGKPVVTANKELMAAHGAELLAAADEAGVDLLFEASVAGAIPLVRLLKESLAGERIVRLTGIVNGTTNYVLTRMSEDGLGYGEAVREAQSLGYAEADPTADVEGYDAAAKAAILAGIAFDADVVASDVHREGITAIEASDIDFAHRLGYEVKLVAVAESEGGAVSARVHPAMLPREHPLASVRGPFNAVFVEGEAAGELMVYGRGAGGRPTASAVLGDVLEAAHHLSEKTTARSARRRRVRLRPIAELSTQYYLSLDVVDRPGVLAAVASVFGEHHVSIRSMEQVGLGSEARLVFITHTAREADLQATIAELAGLDSVERIGCVLRVIGQEPTAGEPR